MSKAPETPRRHRGFTSAGKLLENRIRATGEVRGFAVAKLLTQWAEVVGPELAAACTPVDVKYGRDGGMGATLTILTTGPMAQKVQMKQLVILERVNACYGYRAIARLRITQTAPTGFAEGQVAFDHKPKAPRELAPVTPQAQALADGVENTELRLALAALAANVMAKQKR